MDINGKAIQLEIVSDSLLIFPFYNEQVVFVSLYVTNSHGSGIAGTLLCHCAIINPSSRENATCSSKYLFA